MRHTSALSACTTIGLLVLLLAVFNSARAEPKKESDSDGDEPQKSSQADAAAPADKPAEKPLQLPEWWGESPVPLVKSNCVRCHLTAGRELTFPVQDFGRSVHDYQEMSCYDCHGGNPEDDATAHGEEFAFIGTKLSAHMEVCAGCHDEQATAFAESPHYWDLSESINIDYPVCIDCHGHHDVAKPPEGFELALVCTDCHDNFAEEMPALASVVAENDRYWKVLRQVRQKNFDADHPVPEPFREKVESARTATADVMHAAEKITPQKAQQIRQKMEKLRKELETWLKAHEK